MSAHDRSDETKDESWTTSRFHKAKVFMEKDLKEDRRVRGSYSSRIGGVTHANPRVKDLYQVVDQGGTDFEADTGFATPYEGIMVSTSGTVAFIDGSGSEAEVQLSADELLENVEIHQIVSADTTIQINKITLFR